MGCATSHANPRDAAISPKPTVVPSGAFALDVVAKNEVERLHQMLAQEKDEKRWLMARLENLEVDLRERRGEISRLQSQIVDARNVIPTTAVDFAPALLVRPRVAWPESSGMRIHDQCGGVAREVVLPVTDLAAAAAEPIHQNERVNVQDSAAMPESSHIPEPKTSRLAARRKTWCSSNLQVSFCDEIPVSTVDSNGAADPSQPRVRLGASRDRLRAGGRGKPGMALGLVIPKRAADAMSEQPESVCLDPDLVHDARFAVTGKSEMPRSDRVLARVARVRCHTWAGSSSELRQRRIGGLTGKDAAATGNLEVRVGKVGAQADVGPASPKRVKGRPNAFDV